MTSTSMYPMLLDLQGKKSLVVGGGNVAVRKTKTLLELGGQVKVVSVDFCEDFTDLWYEKRYGQNLEMIEKTYESGDLEGASLAFACTDDKTLNVMIAKQARERGVLVNCTSPPEESDFIVPATVFKGNLTISVSTAGASPALAKKLKEKIEQEFSEDWDKYVELLRHCREELQKVVKTEQTRKECYYQLLETDAVFEQAQNANKDELKELSKSIVEGIITGGRLYNETDHRNQGK